MIYWLARKNWTYISKTILYQELDFGIYFFVIKNIFKSDTFWDKGLCLLMCQKANANTAEYYLPWFWSSCIYQTLSKCIKVNEMI